jgi:hypothetical protein
MKLATARDLTRSRALSSVSTNPRGMRHARPLLRAVTGLLCRYALKFTQT